jgi:hypothetical protein
MDRTFRDAKMLRWPVPGAVALALAGCGGGGGDGGTPLPQNLAIDATNSETVAHASTAGILAISPVQTLPLSSLGVSSRATANGRVGPQRQGWLGRVVAQAWQSGYTKALATGATRARPLSVSGPARA